MSAVSQFEAIVSQFYEPLFRFALSLSRNNADARDLTQHTFFVWATKGNQLHDVTKAKTWLFTTLHRAFLVSRRRRNKFTYQDLDALSDELPAESMEVTRVADYPHVLGALGNVDELYRAAVALFYLEDCSYKDIAA